MDRIIIFCAAYLQYVLVAALVLLSFKRTRMGIAALISAGIARGLIKPLITFFYHRPRPYVVLHTTPLIPVNADESMGSFPSGHAIFFFALAFAVWKYDRRLGWWFLAGAAIMGAARVAAGVHWPSDVVGGAVLGIIVAECVTRYIPALRPRST
jgi:undecaprenyl-diphosphatase